MILNQEKYVLIFKIGIEMFVFKLVFFYGDQFFEECVRNIQWIYQDGDNVYDRFQGLEIEFVDWYVKLNLYMVCCNLIKVNYLFVDKNVIVNL